MKLIHVADIHLGSKMTAKLSEEKSKIRKAELRSTFSRLVDLMEQEGISVMLLSGDVFDSDRPYKQDKVFFYNLVRNHPAIDFLYLKGNHDRDISYTEEDLPNLKVFGEEWTSYTYGDVVIHGIEMAPQNALSFYTTLPTDKTKTNIVMLHGQDSVTPGMDNIVLSRLADKGIDYLALGHIHAHKVGRLDSRGTWAYSGCLEGRGFDECDVKGYVEIEVGDTLTTTFRPFAARTIVELSLDITDTKDTFDAYQAVRKRIQNKDDLYRIYLTGSPAYDTDGMAKELEEYLTNDCFFSSVKDKTTTPVCAEDYLGDISLAGEFVRTVLDSSDYTEEEKQQILKTGLKALIDKEVE